MQQTSFGRNATADDVLESAGLVGFKFGHTVSITTRCHKRRNVDDEMTELFERLSETREDRSVRPDIVICEFREIRISFACFLLQVCVVNRIRVERAFQCIVSAIGESLFAAGPAEAVVGLGFLEFIFIPKTISISPDQQQIQSALITKQSMKE
jgi:hypothetical protein